MSTQETIKKACLCPYCNASFDLKMELEMHVSKFHRDKTPAKSYTPTAINTLKTAQPPSTQQEELIIEYNLAESKAGLGELCAVLKDKDGNIIDGFHRKGENQNWREETLPWIDTPVKLELARLAVNFARRKVTDQELTDRITFLIKSGMKPEEIAKDTGIHVRKIYRHIPLNLKTEKALTIISLKVCAASRSEILFRSFSRISLDELR